MMGGGEEVSELIRRRRCSTLADTMAFPYPERTLQAAVFHEEVGEGHTNHR